MLEAAVQVLVYFFVPQSEYLCHRLAINLVSVNPPVY